MASKLCCTAEQEDHDSPELPNARLAETTTARVSLLPKPAGSLNSRSTSIRTDDLREVRQIFDNAQDESSSSFPTRSLERARFKRPSTYSLHSLHKMRSMRSIIRRKFSRDLRKMPSQKAARRSTASSNDDNSHGTVFKQLIGKNELQAKITRDDLKKDLLADKRPDEGGYDSDAIVLKDITRNIGKKTPNKRMSIHSIDWTSSTKSKPTPESSSKIHGGPNRYERLQPYQIRYQPEIRSTRLSQVLSTPNLQVDPSKHQDRGLRRSHSATSMGLPDFSPLSPMRLPSLKTNDIDGIPWSVALNESLRLSQFPAPPLEVTPKRSISTNTSSRAVLLGREDPPLKSSTVVKPPAEKHTDSTMMRGPRPVRRIGSVNAPSAMQDTLSPGSEIEEDDTRRSVHLYSMRISHHLRSGSLLSWDTIADIPELPSPSSMIGEDSFSNLSRLSQSQPLYRRHERRTSSLGLVGSKVPTKWGRVMSNDIREDRSSIYSCRPQSPTCSLGFSGSMVDFPYAPPRCGDSTHSSIDLTLMRRSNSYPTDNDDTPKPSKRQGLSNLRDVTSYSALTRHSNDIQRLARHNSVASTKLSKFREDLSPSPPKKRLMPSISIMKFLSPKRNSPRSKSDTHVQEREVAPAVDGSLEVPGHSTQRERRLSRSMVSLETEQQALGKDMKASPVWDRALKNYQGERVAMFLSGNRELASQATPFRGRSCSVARSHLSEGDPGAQESSTPQQFSAPSLSLATPVPVVDMEIPSFSKRRTALLGLRQKELDLTHEAHIRFMQQTDTADTVGAWGRYPSHTRIDRTFSAGPTDEVQTRDFALEAAIKFAMGEDNEEIEPTARPVSPPLLTGQKKRKKKLGHTRIVKSHSMTFGKAFLKNYTKMFRSQSIEFRNHGQGHRSSISTGGILQFPELELLPDVWTAENLGDTQHGTGGANVEALSTEGQRNSKDNKGKARAKDEAPTSTTRPLPMSSRPTTGNLLAAGFDGARDTARVWSAYYEKCLPNFPRASTELDFDEKYSCAQPHRSLESRRASWHSYNAHSLSARHSRNPSRISHFSVASHGSAMPSFMSVGEHDGADERSVVSVRRSTMDLITLYKEQENTERERVLKMMRTDSIRESTALSGL